MYARKGCIKVALMPGRFLSPVKASTWFAGMPTVHGPSCFSATPVGPAPHFLLPSASFEAVFNSSAGLTPQIIPLDVGFFEEKKKLCNEQ